VMLPEYDYSYPFPLMVVVMGDTSRCLFIGFRRLNLLTKKMCISLLDLTPKCQSSSWSHFGYIDVVWCSFPKVVVMGDTS